MDCITHTTCRVQQIIQDIDIHSQRSTILSNWRPPAQHPEAKILTRKSSNALHCASGLDRSLQQPPTSRLVTESRWHEKEGGTIQNFGDLLLSERLIGKKLEQDFGISNKEHKLRRPKLLMVWPNGLHLVRFKDGVTLSTFGSLIYWTFPSSSGPGSTR